jgi:hypothetical protein
MITRIDYWHVELSLLRVRVLEETQFTCSTGIPHNKVYNGFVICGKPKHAHVSVYEKPYAL